MSNQISEKQLLQQLKEGSWSAFEVLYNLHSGKLYNFIMRISSGNQYMAEEVVQSTFIRIWEVRDTILSDSSFISFLCTIAKNLLMNMYQRQTIEFVYQEYLTRGIQLDDSDTEDLVNERFLSEYIEKIADEMPEQRKQIFTLCKLKSHSNKEVAQMLGISESTVGTHLSLAVKFMREKLTKHYDVLIWTMSLFSIIR